MREAHDSTVVHRATALYIDLANGLGLVQSWSEVQSGYLFLQQVLSAPDTTFAQGIIDRFERIDKEYQSLISATVMDASLKHVLGCLYGSHGYRPEQGAKLRKFLNQTLVDVQDIVEEVGAPFLSDLRNQCPRMYFLADRDVMDIVGFPLRAVQLVSNRLAPAFQSVSKFEFADLLAVDAMSPDGTERLEHINALCGPDPRLTIVIRHGLPSWDRWHNPRCAHWSLIL